ncbi:MAG: D-glycerate dehydrogenase [Candidatus Sumerlaeaceae bacterium]|nr:D-glycerate dehydrogenase [Candidatus Sumerlaeaceae bacterium]
MEAVKNPRVLVTRRLPGDWAARLRAAGAEIVPLPHDEDIALTREEFLALVAGCHGVGCMLTEVWNAEAFDAAGPQLRIVANYAVGFNNIDLGEAKRRGVVVTNTPDVLTDATADAAWTLLLAAARCAGRGERDVRAGRFQGWGPNDYLGVDLVGKTLGIVGPGRIGTAMARRSRGWDMQVIYSHRVDKPEFEAATGGRRVTLETLLRQSDFISLHVPLTAQTRHLIGARELSVMKPTAVLINTARGPVVDEAALVEALRAGRIFAAGLDVYENEPKLADGLAQLENVVLLPHLGSATFRTRATMAEMVADNIVAVLSGRPAPNPVPLP